MARRTALVIAVTVAVTVAAALTVLVPRAIANPSVVRHWVQPQTVQKSEKAQKAQEGGQTMPKTVAVNFQGDYLGWAMYDRKTGVITGENLDQTSSTESVIKTWLVADYLRTHQKPDDGYLEQASLAIRWSDNDAAQQLYEANGGNESVTRMITMCGLVDTKIYDGWWSRTQMSPRDALKLGQCLQDGTAAGPQWTPWLINEMRHVEGTVAPQDQQANRGGGRWGIIDGVPAADADSVALKNGWTDIGSDGNWHLNCLAFTDDWIISVMMRYPSERGLPYGADTCATITRQLLR